MEGYGTAQIARILKEDKVETPSNYWKRIGRNCPTKPTADPYGWDPKTISGILEKSEYIGHTVNFKTNKISCKSSKTVKNPPEMWKVFKNTHEAIIDEETFDRVQELRQNKRRPTRTGKTNMFSGIVRCADCGEKLYYCTMNNYETRQDISSVPHRGRKAQKNVILILYVQLFLKKEHSKTFNLSAYAFRLLRMNSGKLSEHLNQAKQRKNLIPK